MVGVLGYLPLRWNTIWSTLDAKQCNKALEEIGSDLDSDDSIHNAYKFGKLFFSNHWMSLRFTRFFKHLDGLNLKFTLPRYLGLTY